MEQTDDSTKAVGVAALTMRNNEVTPNALPQCLSEAPVRSGARSNSTTASKDGVSVAGHAPSGAMGEHVCSDTESTQPGKDGLEPWNVTSALENGSNEPRSAIISTKATQASEPVDWENSATLTGRDSIGGQSVQGLPLPNELGLIPPSPPSSPGTPITGAGDAVLLKTPVLSVGENRGTNTNDGTVVAQMENAMKTMIKGNKSAVKVEQKLPPVSLGGLDTTDADFSEKAKANDGSPVKETPPPIPWLPLVADDRFPGWSAKLESTSGIRSVSTSEQLFFQISKQAVALKHFNADSMAVVLKPDPETAIFLHLQLENGRVEVHARFERGDYQALQSGWDQLRESLASQGIRLGPLHNSDSNDYTTAGQPSDKFGYGKGEKYSNPQTPEPADAMSEVFASPRKEVSRRPISHSVVGEKRQWEHWA
jgi:hypothetical protein